MFYSGFIIGILLALATMANKLSQQNSAINYIFVIVLGFGIGWANTWEKKDRIWIYITIVALLSTIAFNYKDMGSNLALATMKNNLYKNFGITPEKPENFEELIKQKHVVEERIKAQKLEEQKKQREFREERKQRELKEERRKAQKLKEERKQRELKKEIKQIHKSKPVVKKRIKEEEQAARKQQDIDIKTFKSNMEREFEEL